MRIKLKLIVCNNYWVPELRMGPTKMANNWGKRVIHWHIWLISSRFAVLFFTATFLLTQGVDWRSSLARGHITGLFITFFSFMSENSVVYGNTASHFFSLPSHSSLLKQGKPGIKKKHWMPGTKQVQQGIKQGQSMAYLVKGHMKVIWFSTCLNNMVEWEGSSCSGQ